MKKEHEIIDLEKKYIGSTFKRYNMVIQKGKGCILTDTDGKDYLDFFSGIAVNAFGYNDKEINHAINKQIECYTHLSNNFYDINQIKLAQKICQCSFGSKVFFVNTGAEANEVAFKFVRKWGILHKKRAYKIISFFNSFHGRTMGALTATAQEKFHKYLNPLSPGFVYAKYNDIDDVKSKIDEETAAIIIELIQAEGGVNIAQFDFLEKLRNLCNEKKILLIVDEVQTGLGRTGYLFAYEYFKIQPDVMTLGKGLGGGIPLSAVVIDKKFEDVFTINDHGTTMGGNPVACAAGNILMNRIDDKFLESVRVKSDCFMEELKKINSKYIKEIRGVGLLVGIQLNETFEDITTTALERGLIINMAGNAVIRLVPPLIIEKDLIKEGVSILKDILEK